MNEMTASHHVAAPEPAPSSAVDPITLEVLRHRLWMINDEQGRLAMQISGSPVVYESKDFNSALLTPEGDSIFVGVYMTRIALSLDVAAKHIIAEYHDNPGIEDGDIFITNDPWVGAGHQNDFLVLAPIFWDGELVCWSGLALHDVDVGGPVPGGFSPGARTVFDEAPLIPPMRLVEGGRMRSDIEALILRNTRTPDVNGLNLRARLAAVSRTRERLHDVIREFGKDVFVETQREMLALVRRAFLRRLADFPDGTWREEGYLDHDGTNNGMFPIRATLTKNGERLTFDFEGTSPQVDGPVNCTAGGLQCGVVSAILATLCYDMPWSPGALKGLFEIRADDGLINNALYPAAVSMATMSAIYATQHVVAGAIAKMLASAGEVAHRLEAQASWTPAWQVTVISGDDLRGQPFAAMLLDQTGGGGACLDRDGLDTGGIPGAPSQAIPNLEAYEHQYPVLYIYRKQCPDTGGAGRQRGGVGTETLFIPYRHDGPLAANVISHGVSQPEGRGLFGGCPGSVQVRLLMRETNIRELFAKGVMPTSLEEIRCAHTDVLEAKDRTVLNPGDALVAVGGGGGGYGDPLERAPASVARDQRLGLCSRASAEDLYGIAFNGHDDTIDETATERRRAALCAARLAEANPADATARRPSGYEAARPLAAAAIGDAYAAVELDGVRLHTCRRCGTTYGPLHVDPKRYALVREVAITQTSHWNRFGLVDGVKILEFYCPGCALMIATQVRKNGDAILWDMSYATPTGDEAARRDGDGGGSGP